MAFTDKEDGMCCIAGFCNLKGDWRANIAKMNERMHHRGPDAEGVFASGDERVVLGHKRLSIVDLSVNGAQPMDCLLYTSPSPRD